MRGWGGGSRTPISGMLPSGQGAASSTQEQKNWKAPWEAHLDGGYRGGRIDRAPQSRVGCRMPKPILLLALLAGCATTSPASRVTGTGAAADRLLERHAEADLHRDDPSEGPPAAAELAKQHGGWAQLLTAERATLELPAAQLDAVMGELGKLGEVESRRVVAADDTDTHRDLLVRIDNLKSTRTRYLALLAQAQNVAEATGVERELERVTLQLERLESELQALSQRVEYASLDLRFSRKLRPGPVGWVFYGAFRAIGWLFIRD